MNPMFQGLGSALKVILGGGVVLFAAHQLAKGRERKAVDDRLARLEKLLAELKDLQHGGVLPVQGKPADETH